MVKEFNNIKEMKEHLNRSLYETQNIELVEKELALLWFNLKEKQLFLSFDKITGHNAYCMLMNSYKLVYSVTRFTSLVEDYLNEIINIKDKGIQEEDLILLVCMSYNVYVEKIADLFSIILDIPQLCRKNKSFYSASDIIDCLSNLLPSSKMFRYTNRDIRNALAHYDFNIHKGCLIYNTKKKYKKQWEGKTLNLTLLINASLNLNRFIVFLFKKIESDLTPFFDEQRVKKNCNQFDECLSEIIERQKNKDCL